MLTLSRNRKALLAGSVCAAMMIGASAVWTNAFAATLDGSVGTTSTGTVDISAAVNAVFSLTKMTAIVMTPNPWVGTGNMTGSDSVCVWGNVGGGGTVSYKVTASGDGAASAFTLDSGTAPVLPYTVEWDDGDDGTGEETLTTTVLSTTTFSSTRTSKTCAGGTNARVIITILESNLEATDVAIGGSTYTGVLTLVVSAN